MSRIKISNFGPIKKGFSNNDGWMDIPKITLFIGNQGSGKSTIAKLISTLTWIEKALVRGDFQEKDLTIYNRFKKYCAYQNIGNYFQEKTCIEYKGVAYNIFYKDGNTKVEKNSYSKFLFPKIMYVPADRNFLSSVDRPSLLKRLPSTLYTFLDELEAAKQEIKGSLILPIGDVRFEYSKQNKISYIVGNDYKIRLSESSSGFQSFVPLYLVSKYLSEFLNKEHDASIKQNSVEESKRITKELEKILSNPHLTEELKNAAIELLSSKNKYASFINIVEEPEQNLFPSSQRNILNSLLEFANNSDGNKLIMTTHSPYIINYLSVSIQGFCLKEKKLTDELLGKLNRVVPVKSIVNPLDIVVYQLNEADGTIQKLPQFEGIPSDKNYLNSSLMEANQLFDSLLEIEEEI
jgi:predicted ATPase